MRLRRAMSSCTSFAPARAFAFSVAWLMAPFAYSSWTAMARSALSIETLARRAAASTVAVEISDIGFAVVVGMAVLLGSGGAASPSCTVDGAPQQFHSRNGCFPCQALFDALHQGVASAMQQNVKMQ